MAFKPNYRQQRNERSHSKEQKKQEKLQRRTDGAAKRKVERERSPDLDEEATVPSNLTEVVDGQEEATRH